MSDTTSGGFMANLMSPETMGLLGAAQGFAQAAMPTRMPIPFGAAVGMGAGGMASGLQNAYRLQLEQQQAKAAQIANDRAMMLLNWYKNALPPSGAGGQSAPFGAPASAGAGQPQADANGQYLVPPTTLRSMGDLSLMAGDPKAAATFYGQLQTGAGGAGYAYSPNGTAFAVPGGAKDPRTLATNAYAAAEGKLGPDLAAKGWQMGPNGLQPISGGPSDPAYQATLPRVLRPGGMLIANGQTIKNPELERVKTANGAEQFMWVTPPEPTGVPGARAMPAQPAVDPFPAWGQRIDQVENATGNPAATNPNSTASGNGQFIDQTWPQVIRATRPDLAAGKTDQQLLALRNVPGLAEQATTMYARQNAAALAQSHLPITPGTIYLSHVLGSGGAAKVLQANPNTPLSMLLPQQVIAGNPQFQGGKTAGDAVIWAQNQMRVPGTAAPQQADDGAARPVLGPNGQPALAEISPTQEEALKSAGKEYDTKDAESYEAALNTQAMLAHGLADERAMLNAGGLFTTGPGAEARLNFMAKMNDALRAVGAKQLFDPSAIGGWEDMRKNMIRAGFELSSHYEGRARQAASVIENATSAVPGDHNSPVGFQLVSAGVYESAQQAADLYNYKTQLYKAQSPDLVTAENDYYKKWSPEMYAQRAISSVHPIHIKPDAPQSVLNKYLPGTMLVLPVPKGSPGYDPRFGGKPFQVPARAGAPGVPTYLQGDEAPVAPAVAASPPIPLPPALGGANG